MNGTWKAIKTYSLRLGTPELDKTIEFLKRHQWNWDAAAKLKALRHCMGKGGTWWAFATEPGCGAPVKVARRLPDDDRLGYAVRCTIEEGELTLEDMTLEVEA